jgi:uncharacterized protein (DUF1800 family)
MMHDRRPASRFTRRIAFGLRPGEAIPADPVQWAIERLDNPEALTIRDREGRTREDLPNWVELKRDQRQAMAWFESHLAAEQKLREELRVTPRENSVQLQRDRIGIPFRQVEHWKEVQARATTAVTGGFPVFEKFWHFWTNHFMVAPPNQNVDTLIGPCQRMLREHMSGSYRDMLWHAVTHPAMLLYLDNNRSTGPNSRVGKRRAGRESINENLGRELLELFTLSPRAAYSQADVEQATLILTGWRVHIPARAVHVNAESGTFFDADRHEPGVQQVLGRTYEDPVSGQRKLQDLITDLAHHPSTAAHLARKLCVVFVDDNPPDSAIAHVQQRFLASEGNIREVHLAVIEMVWRHIGSTRKLSTPESWLLQWHTMTGSELPSGSAGLGFPPGQARRDTSQMLRDLGQALPWCPQPDGWPIRSTDWISKELLDRRVRHALLAAEDLWRRGEITAHSVTALAARELNPHTPTVDIIQRSISQGQIAQALALLMVSPELLWS